ncbi:Uncharacterized protein TCAP_02737, partial [Tolypocladium capitatum]
PTARAPTLPSHLAPLQIAILLNHYRVWSACLRASTASHVCHCETHAPRARNPLVPRRSRGPPSLFRPRERQWRPASRRLSGAGHDPRAGRCKSPPPHRLASAVSPSADVSRQPYCTQILGDLGAEVIKIEHPVRGDDTRAWGPPYAEYKPRSGVAGPGEAAYFLGANRNKKSLALSFQHQQGVDILHRLVAKCDILVENYLPGTLKKYSMDYEALRSINPSLVYASITGYGQTGPYSHRAGYDVMVEAEFGLMHITGSRDGPPVKVGVAVTDLTTGLYTSNSIMAALLRRARTGKGQHIDVALSDCQTATLANIASSCLISGERDTGRWGTAHPSIVPYRSFKTKDGDILFGGGNDRLFGVLCDGLGRPRWKDDAKFKTNADRVANRVELEAEIEAVSQQRTTREWLETFEGSGMPYAAVNDVQDTLNHEHTKARNMVVEMEHEACGPIRMVNTPVKFSESQPTIRSVPPMLGQHTDEVLSEHLGLSESDIAGLKKQGVVKTTPARQKLTATRRFTSVTCFHHWTIGWVAVADADVCAHASSLTINPAQVSHDMAATPTAKSTMEPEQYVPITEHLSVSPRMDVDATDGPAVEPNGLYKASKAQPSYAPQFSTASSLILNRIKRGTKTLSSVAPAHVGPGTSVEAQSALHTSSTLAIASPRRPGLQHSLSDVSGVIRSHPPRLKRKRDSDAADTDFTQSTIPFRAAVAPASTTPTPAPQLKRLSEVSGPLKCIECGQGTPTPQNEFVTCRSCSGSWHQLCLSPAVTDGAAKNAKYLCRRCENGGKGQQHSDGAESQDRGHLVDRIRRKRISNLPPGVVPAKPELVGFLARQASSSERAEYFYSKKRTDLLNILSLCDQLKPQLLVDILVSVSRKHPDLPMYDDPDWRANLPSASGPKRSATRQRPGVTGRPRHGHTLVHPSASRKVKGSRKVLKRITVMRTEDEAPAEDREEGDEEEDSLPPTWPKAGEGLYAKLPPEDEDRTFLEDDNDEEAFSHFMVDRFGKQMAVPVCA